MKITRKLTGLLVLAATAITMTSCSCGSWWNRQCDPCYEDPCCPRSCEPAPCYKDNGCGQDSCNSHNTSCGTCY